MNTAAAEIDVAQDASDAEVTRYERAYRETRRVLDESIEALMVLEEFEEDPPRRDQLALKRLELETSRSDLVRANIAFHAGRVTMTPPSPGLVAEIVELSKKAVELTVERATAAAVLRLATSALTKFAEIQKIEKG
jgi:hypothetical protein